MGEFTEEWVDNKGTSFYTRFYQPSGTPKAAVVLVHGYIEHVGRYEHVLPSFKERGIAVLAYDQRGYGRTATDPKRSPSSAYGKTTFSQKLADIEFFLNLAKERFATNDLFLYGHSLGGALALSYVCVGPDSTGIKAHLKGVLSSAPLIRQTAPSPRWQRLIVRIASRYLPWVLFPTPVDAYDLSHDTTIVKAYANDPLVIQKSSLAAINSMLAGGEDLEATHYSNWPKDLPLIVAHGTADRVTSFTSTKRFMEVLSVDDKTFIPYEGTLHELHNEPEVKEDLIRRYVDWTEKRISPTAS